MLTPTRKLALLSVALIATGATGVSVVASHRSPLDSGAQWWQFAIAFIIAERAVAHVEIRREAHTLSLSEAVTLVGLVLLTPLGLMAARLCGGLLALAIRRQPIRKFAFNSSVFVFEAGVAVGLFHAIVHIAPPGPLVWPVAGIAVLVAGSLGSGAVVLVISFFDDIRPVGLLRRALEAYVLTAMGSMSLAVLSAGAIIYSWTNVIYITVMAGTIFLLLKQQAATAQRASNLESMRTFTAKLVGLRSTDEVIEVSLREAAQTMRSAHAAIVIHAKDGKLSRVFRLDSDSVSDFAEHEFLDSFAGITDVTSLTDGDNPDSHVPEGFVAPIRVDGAEGLFAVWDRSTHVGQYSGAFMDTYRALIAQVEVALERAKLVDQLHHDAHHDALTSLPNRLGLTVAVDRAETTSGALLVLDLDRFKDINDTLGHPIGDQALQIIAERLVAIAGTSMVLARLGGDEFAVFDPACGEPEQAKTLAIRITDAIEQPIVFADMSLQVGASIGVALAPEDGQDLTTLMKHADSAMYRAKHGQLGWGFYRSEDDKNDPRRLELVSALRNAIDARELEIAYQPKLRLPDREVVGAEALARWHHERYGQIPAGEFIELAETSGLMRDLTDAVLEGVVADMQRWIAADNCVPVAVNLSARNLLDDSLPQRVADLLHTSGVDPRLLSFEITETAIMLDRERVAGLLTQFSALGISLAIDDYGTGYSSLSYLRELPVSVLKIDRSFVSDLDLDPHNEVIVRSTVNLAHSLGLTVIAEGVEREAEEAMLVSLGCDVAQGYLYSRPVPRDRFDLWRANHREDQMPSFGHSATKPAPVG